MHMAPGAHGQHLLALLVTLMGVVGVTLARQFGSLDANCSYAQFNAQVQSMTKACCPAKGACAARSLPNACPISCALSFVPMYHDCMHTIDAMCAFAPRSLPLRMRFEPTVL